MASISGGVSLLRSKVREASGFFLGMYGYVYGFPLVIMSVTKDVMTAASTSGEYIAPINQFHRIRGYGARTSRMLSG